MARKRLSDLLQEETQKVTQIEDAAAIDVKATPVEDFAPENREQVTSSKTTKRTSVTKADLEATVKQLKQTLEQAYQNEASFQDRISDLQSELSKQEGLASELEKELKEAKKLADLEVTVQELKQQLEQAQHNETNLEQRVHDLQATIAAKEELTERLKLELYQAKQDAVKLAEINSALTEQINNSKQHKPQQKQKSAIQPAKSNLRPDSYRKSHLVRDTRPIPRSPKPSGPSSEDSSDSSSQMWLLD